MSTHITDTLMTSDQTRHVAALDQGGWAVSYLPAGWRVTRNQAITAMTLAEALGKVHPAHIDNWAAELGLTAAEVIALIGAEVSDVQS